MYIDRFIKYLHVERRYSAHTLKSYQLDLEQFRAFACGASGDMSDAEVLTSNTIKAWMVSLRERGLSARSINRKLTCLRTYVRFLRSREIFDDDPFVHIRSLKEKKRLTKYVRESQMNMLLADDVYTNDFAGIRDQAIIEIFYNTGMRLSELINVKHCDIDTYAATVKVLGKGNKERLIPINPFLMNIINRYTAAKKSAGFATSGNDPLLVTDKGRKLYGTIVYKKVVHYLSLVTTIEKRSPHVLRHTFATLMLNNGADINAIKELLGHSSLAATQVYTHNDFAKMKKVYKQAHPRA